MKLLLQVLVMVAAAAIGLAIGFAWRGRPASVPGATPALNPPAPAGASRTPPRISSQPAGMPPRDDSPLATQLERDLSMASGVTRWLYWLDAIERAAPADFPRLARLARDNPTALRFVAARWVEVAPRHMFDALVEATKGRSGLPVQELADVLFAEWPKHDPEAAIAALNGPESFGQRTQWRWNVATAVILRDPERGLRVMAEWHIEDYGPHMTAVAKWAAADPRHAAEFTLEKPSGYVSRLAMETIGKEWAKTDPAAALAFAVDRPSELGSALAESALKTWAARNPTEAAAWLAQADPRTRNRLGASFVEAWAKQDASGALAWCQANLTGSSLAQAVGGVLKGVAAKDLAGAAALVAAMDPSPARSEGALAVAEKWFPRFTANQPVKPETVAWLARLDADSLKRVLNRVQWEWSTVDPKSMAAFLAAASREQIPAHTDSILAQQLARQNPAEALSWASRLPDQRGLAAGSEAFAEWRSSQPEAARAWWNQLPADDPRREPFLESAIRTLAYHPQADAHFAAMDAAERAEARRLVERMSLAADRRARLLELLRTR